MLSAWCCGLLLELERDEEDRSVLLEWYAEERMCARFRHLLCCPGKSSGQNGISHPHVKSINVPNKNSKFFLLYQQTLPLPPPVNPWSISPYFLFCLLSLDPTPFHIHINTLLSISSFANLEKKTTIKKKQKKQNNKTNYFLSWKSSINEKRSKHSELNPLSVFLYIHFYIYFSSSWRSTKMSTFLSLSLSLSIYIYI